MKKEQKNLMLFVCSSLPYYFDLDAEIVFDVCKNEMPKLKGAIEYILNDLENK